MKRLGCAILLVMLVMLAPGCGKRPVDQFEVRPEFALKVVETGTFELDDDLDVSSLLTAVDRSLAYYEGAGRGLTFTMAGRRGGAAELRHALVVFRDIITTEADPDQKKRQIAKRFLLLRAAGRTGQGDVLFTGYYVPLLEGSFLPSEKYRYPLYKVPPDLVTQKISAHETKIGRNDNGRLIPYYTRKEIDQDGVLRGKNLELIWVSVAVDLFSLHIQGSGKILLENGRILTVSTAQNNGWPYRSMPEDLQNAIRRDQGHLSYLSVKTWLKRKSDADRNRILSYYDRYNFFRFVDHDPIGGLGQPVTPDRTIATDPEFFPPGALAFIRLRKPVFDERLHIISYRTFSRFVLNQDEGAAIKGAGRVDLFCGVGPRAQAAAGSLKETGELYFLILR
jgi:membrane-bound lytic murein transglycosylase A